MTPEEKDEWDEFFSQYDFDNPDLMFGYAHRPLVLDIKIDDLLFDTERNQERSHEIILERLKEPGIHAQILEYIRNIILAYSNIDVLTL